MHVQVHGEEGAPVIALLHGGGLAGWMWDAQVSAFRDTHRILVFDLPGHGDSAHEPFTTIEAAAHGVTEALGALDRSRGACVVGFSLGAQIALQLLCDAPGLVDSAVIVSALTHRLPGAGLARPMARLTLPLARWRPFARLQARASDVPEAMFEPYFRSTRRLSAGTLGNLLAANMSFGLPEGWAQAKGDVQVVVGEREKPVMRRSATLLQEARPATVLTVVERGGHGIPLQDPDGFTRLMREHLRM